MPASRAAPTTAALSFSPIRQPKLLQPRPTRVTSSDPIRRFSIVFSSDSFSFDARCYPEYLNYLVWPRTALLCLTVLLASAQSPAPAADPKILLDSMTQELDRNFTALKAKADPAPYFLSYEVTEVDYRSLSATLGTLTSTSGGKSRSLDVSVRVGSPKMDNYRRIRGDRGQ